MRFKNKKHFNYSVFVHWGLGVGFLSSEAGRNHYFSDFSLLRPLDKNPFLRWRRFETRHQPKSDHVPFYMYVAAISQRNLCQLGKESETESIGWERRRKRGKDRAGKGKQSKQPSFKGPITRLLRLYVWCRPGRRRHWRAKSTERETKANVRGKQLWKAAGNSNTECKNTIHKEICWICWNYMFRRLPINKPSFFQPEKETGSGQGPFQSC